MVEAGAVKLLTKVVVLAGKVTKLVDVEVLGARVWVVVETYGTVMYSVYVWTLADELFVSSRYIKRAGEFSHLAGFVFPLS
jgi:hypothetical protein